MLSSCNGNDLLSFEAQSKLLTRMQEVDSLYKRIESTRLEERQKASFRMERMQEEFQKKDKARVVFHALIFT